MNSDQLLWRLSSPFGHFGLLTITGSEPFIPSRVEGWPETVAFTTTQSVHARIALRNARIWMSRQAPWQAK
jgi:hypothetical protein